MGRASVSAASSLITFSSMAGLVGCELMSRPPSLSLVLVPHLVMRTLTASVLAAAWRGVLADNIGVRGEYTYTIYGVDDFTVNGTAVEEDITQHLFRVGIAYYF